MQATAAGAKEQEATNALEKKFKAPADRPMTVDETVRLAITTMQGVLSSDFKAAEIEISLVGASGVLEGAAWLRPNHTC